MAVKPSKRSMLLPLSHYALPVPSEIVYVERRLCAPLTLCYAVAESAQGVVYCLELRFAI